MKSKAVLVTLLFFSGFLIVTLSGNAVFSDETGAPAAMTGSPADAQTCAKSNCHTGNAVTATPGLISSNIPAAGYVPGNTYTITATLSQTGNSCWGFEISPQSATGALRGTPVITNTTETKIVSTKYVTHKLAGITGANTKTWSFNWIAPASGTGSVTFYGAFNYCNGNGSRTGDFIHTSSYAVNEFVSSVSENKINRTFNVFPNPVEDHSQLSVYLKEAGMVKMSLYSLNGELIRTLCEENDIKGSYIYNFEKNGLAPGLYLVSLQTDEGVTSKKLMVL